MPRIPLPMRPWITPKASGSLQARHFLLALLPCRTPMVMRSLRRRGGTEGDQGLVKLKVQVPKMFGEI